MVAMLALALGTALAQVQTGERPVSMDESLALGAPPVHLLPGVDRAALLAEDRVRAADKSLPWRFGQPFDVALHIDTHGVWTVLPDGSRLWRLAVVAPGAVHQNLLLDRFRVPPGARLWVVGEGHRIGAFTEENHQPDGTLATTLVRGQQVVLEYHEPADALFPGEISVARVTHGYRDAFAKAASLDKSLGSSGSCNVDVACNATSDWPEQVRSVGMMVVDGSGFCTGALVNTLANDNRATFLTANHCIVGDDPSGWVFWFNWQRTACDGPMVADPDTMSGATLLASRADSDFALLELNESVPLAYDLYFAGTDHRGAAPQSSFAIHHPSGDAKMYSFDADPLEFGRYQGSSGTHWRVRDWDLGTTEGGSSGSPLFSDEGLIVGQLHGGGAACGNDRSDYYGRVDVSWDGDAPDARLRDHLDPDGVSDGWIPGRAADVVVDVGIDAVEWPVPDAEVCAGGFQPRVRVRNGGRDPVTSFDVAVGVDGGAPVVTTWTGELLPGRTTVVLPAPIDVSPGPRLLTVRVQRDTPDDAPLNDRASIAFTAAGARPAPFLERFDDQGLPVGWQQVPSGDTRFEWAFFGARSFGAMGFDNWTHDRRGRPRAGLITPAIDLTALASAQLDLEVAYARGPFELDDALAIQVSDDCGTTWTPVADITGDTLVSAPDAPDDERFVPDVGQYAPHTVDLTPWAGSPKVQVRVDNVAQYGNAVYVDNLRVSDGSPPDAGVPTDPETPAPEPRGCAIQPASGLQLFGWFTRTRR
jgi:hypothetical protein